MKFTIYEPGEAPAVEYRADLPKSHLTPREKNTLALLGIYNGRADWLKEAPDGSVWAGGDTGKIAKVRGKEGRRLGGRTPLPQELKRRTTSIQLAGPDREKLERLASRATEAQGKRVTISDVVQGLVRHAQV